MKSYLKIYGPPLAKALEALRKVAIDMPEICVMDMGIQAAVGAPSPGILGAGDYSMSSIEGIRAFFGEPDISKERCNTIISKSGESLGNYDFFYEWYQKPTVKQVEDLIGKIDDVLAPIGVRYTITTK